METPASGNTALAEENQPTNPANAIVDRDGLDDSEKVRLMTQWLQTNPALMASIAEGLLPHTIGQTYNVSPFLPFVPPSLQTREEFRQLPVGGYGLQRLLDDWQFQTVADIGAGLGLHADIMLAYGKDVTEVDLGRTVNFSNDRATRKKVLVADINHTDPPERFDCIWASHILEHQPNVQHFVRRLKAWAKPGGIIAVTVPPLKNEVVSGHLNLFTPGHLLYNMVAAGIDCSKAVTLAYHYNLSVIVENQDAEIPELTFDAGDIEKLLPWLPDGFEEGIDGFSTRFVDRHPDPPVYKRIAAQAESELSS